MKGIKITGPKSHRALSCFFPSPRCYEFLPIFYTEKNQYSAGLPLVETLEGF
jgi:hypothetical protein